MAASIAPVELVLSIDVEEEGLFRGAYARAKPTVRNVAGLARLSPVLEEFGLPVSLLCTHSVFADAAACRVLADMCARHRVEIGAHLHHWNTPPAGEGNGARQDYESPGQVPDDLLRARLASLFAVGGDFLGMALTSFRMGRWDLHRRHWPLLAEAGVLVDASVRPLHYAPHGPDHFAAPADPYVVNVAGRAILEVPLSCTPVCACLRRLLPPSGVPGAVRGRLAASVRQWGALALLPVYHPLWAMKAVTKRHLAQGGRVLSLTWHSSEMMPGAAPHMPDASAVERFLGKIRGYLRWLTAWTSVEGRTLNELRHAWAAGILALGSGGTGAARGGDWRY
ncbi:MAG: glycosyl transferase family 1 [Deltaproteobacteria bacterium]|nr:glycosyl transferase family 1 [Deltaproteobacteria bacterium]